MTPRRGTVPPWVALAVALFLSPSIRAANDARVDTPASPTTQVTSSTDAAGDGDVQAPRISRHWDVRMRLDDGRYRGFHQSGGDDPTRDDIGRAENTRQRVYDENNQIRAEHRARGRDLYP